jgi:hypothetical protein
MTSAATGTKNMSNAPWPPPPPVDDTPEFGGAGAFGASGGNGRGALGSAGGCERPPEAPLFTLEWTVDRAMACAELELVSSVALVCSTTPTDELRLTTERDVRMTIFGLCTERCRSCWATGPARGNGLGPPIGSPSGIGCGETARTSTGPALATITGALDDADDGAAFAAAGAGT